MFFEGDAPFVFVHIPRTGGTSVENALCRHLLGRPLEALSTAEAGMWKLPCEGSVHQHCDLREYEQSLGCEVVEKAFVFSFVRNPWDLVLSEIRYFRKYHGGMFQGGSWKERIAELLAHEAKVWGHDFMPQVRYLKGVSGRVCDFVGRFEELGTHFAEVCGRLGLPSLPLEKVLPTVGEDTPHYSECYDEESMRWVGERYAEDIAAFGYEFERPGKRQVRGFMEGAGVEEALARAEKKAQPSRSGHAKYIGLKKWGWYLDDLVRWVARFGSDERRKVLEIGAFDGVSANRMLDVVFRHAKSEVHCIDAFLPDPTTPQVNDETKGNFEKNAGIGEHGGQIHLYEGLSAEVLAWMLAEEGFWESFDFIYVDGSHQARHVLMDATMAWNLLKVGGVMVFDDYEWGFGEARYGRPRPAIDAFECIFGDRLQRVLGGYRRGYGKLSA